MSKLIVQSRTFLPMVIKKCNAIENSSILEARPTVSTKLTTLTKEAPNEETPTDIESPKEGTVVKILLEGEKLARSNDFTAKQFQERTHAQALMLDMVQVQGWVARLLARGHMWMFRPERGVLRTQSAGDGPTTLTQHLVLVEGRLRVKEEEPNAILPEHSKTKPMRQKYLETYALKKEEVKSSQKSETKSSPMKSNFVDSLLERSPAWQKSISANLGALQKKIVDKLPK